MPFELVRNDITKMNTDAIVNAANCSLLGGGGVDGAIHRAAGPDLLEECRALGGCQTGEAKITKGYRLPARYVIHTVGPVWHGGQNGERELLVSCYLRSLELAAENKCESIAFPMISAGAYGYPKDQAIAVAVETITRFLLTHDMMVYLVVFGHEELLTGSKLFRNVKEYIDDVYAEQHIRNRTENTRKQLWQENEKAALDLDMELSPYSALQAPCPTGAPKARARKAVLRDSKIPKAEAPQDMSPVSAKDLENILKKTDEGFSESLLRIIDEKELTDVQCYKKANVDRKLFSKIRSNPDYRPSKPTVFAFAVALELSLPETRKLLGRAGFSLSHSNTFDIAMEYFIRNRIYNIYEINEILFAYDMPLLGSGMS